MREKDVKLNIPPTGFVANLIILTFFFAVLMMQPEFKNLFTHILLKFKV